MARRLALRNRLETRKSLRTPRAAAVAGIIFSLLLIAALVLPGASPPADPAQAGAWLTSSTRRAEVALALNLIPFAGIAFLDRKSTRLNSSHRCISYAVFCLKK